MVKPRLLEEIVVPEVKGVVDVDVDDSHMKHMNGIYAQIILYL